MNTTTNTIRARKSSKKHDINAAGRWVKTPTGSRYRYFVRLDEADMHSLAYCRDRGYDCGLLKALEATTIELADGRIVYEIAECDVWTVSAAAGDDRSGFGNLAWDSNLGEELSRLLNGAV